MFKITSWTTVNHKNSIFMDCKKTLHPFQLPPYLCLIFCFNLFCLTLFWCYIYFATNFLFYLPSTFLATILLGTTLHVAFIFRPFSSCCLSWYSTSFLSTSFFTSCSLTVRMSGRVFVVWIIWFPENTIQRYRACIARYIKLHCLLLW